ncbi:hypothetical protein [Paenibacillus thalictri]|uniref:Uncharacterized protein n=1 Tax=Paenibacillus thalictri TaxID=2527873 RepID=A0A4Q9DZJ2_9BACL|nr:hypothetical protein [Paenibacillus thalictri]TBL81348.1 hypothetical protein EYB31_04500 [Paenibacillus thalictri]
MSNVSLRPDLKTSGGEVQDIVWKGRYIGTMTLVYRESDRLSGAIQLEAASLGARDKEEVAEFLQDYVQYMAGALNVMECDVVMTYSPYDRIFADKNESEAIRLGGNVYYAADEDYDYDTWEDPERFEDPDASEQDEISMKDTIPSVQRRGPLTDDDEITEMFETEEWDRPDYELVVVGEDQESVEYHVYDQDDIWIAEALLHIEGRDVYGSVNWLLEPLDEEIDQVADLIVSDFDEHEMDTFVINMIFENDVIETIELTHQDLLDDADTAEWPYEKNGYEWEQKYSDLDDEYTIVLARDDGDMLTYEIYQQSRGGLPIGTATIDISQRLLSGFIDFREPGDENDREHIAALLMQELDKEKDFEQMNLTMLHKNEPFEELMLESEPIH